MTGSHTLIPELSLYRAFAIATDTVRRANHTALRDIRRDTDPWVIRTQLTHCDDVIIALLATMLRHREPTWHNAASDLKALGVKKRMRLGLPAADPT